MVHSSLKSFGRVDGGPRTVVDALMDVLTPQGTLMMPSFNHGKAFGPEGPGVFDPLTTPSANGAITQVFWQMPDVYRSLHPTHSFAAWGRDARTYTEHHHRTLTCGPESPLGRLARDDGYGLLIGVGYRANTYHHVVEMTLGAPCLGRRTTALPVKLPNGRIVQARAWTWRERNCPINETALYAHQMERRGLHRQTTIGLATVTCFRLHDAFDVIAELLQTGTDEHPPCAKCPIRPQQTDRAVPSDWDEDAGRVRPDSESLTY
jgi:aminoglycoside N3'-acetyltransferase